jgi:cytochrome c
VGGKVELRLGSLKGQLLGESPFLEASEKMDFTPKTLTIPINLTGVATDKLQDVYAVFVNPKAEGSLMVVMGLEFKMMNEGAAVEEPKAAPAASNVDFFVGKWNMAMIGTPGGDVQIALILERKDGKLTGKMSSEKMGGDQALEKVEETDSGKIKVFFQANGMSINMDLEKDSNDAFKGKLMNMFEVKGKRLN